MPTHPYRFGWFPRPRMAYCPSETRNPSELPARLAGSESVGQEGPRLVLHGCVEGVSACAERAAVARRSRMQLAESIVSRRHPGPGEQLVLGPVLNQESSLGRRGQVGPVRE